VGLMISIRGAPSSGPDNLALWPKMLESFDWIGLMASLEVA